MPSPRELDPSESMLALFGSELRDHRTKARLSQEGLGDLLGYTGSLIGQIETGRRTPTREFAERVDATLDAAGIFSKLWPHVTRGQFPSFFKSYAELEPRACQMLEYGGDLIPGLGQTEGYMRAVFEAGLPLARPELIEEKVAARLGRQQLLTGPTRPLLWWLLSENAIRRPVGGFDTMADQLAKLVGLVRSRMVVIQVLETSRGAHALLEGSMTLMSFTDGTPDTGYVEAPHTGVLVENPDRVRELRLSYDLARADALSPEASLNLVEKVAKEHQHHADEQRAEPS
ncbi:Scr1 family TA system antitoxin-like transcriptional regulator [Kitasatospora sp. NPDC051853]|uniref:helix-turn-helix domain-containing protein n=1 Tax=Kitasatospora sp. NPDC051853 TaxID=3364058 RepID=UPI0037A7120B